jgi:hypothetical protein
VQASSSLSMICARAWPTGATRQRNPFPPFFARVFYILIVLSDARVEYGPNNEHSPIYVCDNTPSTSKKLKTSLEIESILFFMRGHDIDTGGYICSHSYTSFSLSLSPFSLSHVPVLFKLTTHVY